LLEFPFQLDFRSATIALIVLALIFERDLRLCGCEQTSLLSRSLI